MSRFFLRIRDSLSLSFTKFKIRRVRTALTLISTSVLVLILVVASSVITGMMKAGEQAAFSQLTDLHLAQVYSSSDPTTQQGSTDERVAKAKDDVRKKVKDPATLRDTYIELMTDPAKGSSVTFDLLRPPAGAEGLDGNFGFVQGRGLGSQSTDMLEPFVDPSQTLDWSNGQPLPLLVPIDSLIDVHRKEFSKIKDAKVRVAKRQEYERAVIGKTGTLSLENPNLEMPNVEIQDSGNAVISKPQPTTPTVVKTLPVRVVGFLPAANGVTNAGTSWNYLLPYETTKTNPDVASFVNFVEFTYPSFTTTEARNKFVKDTENASIYADVVEANEEYTKHVRKAFNIAVIVMLVLMAIPMAATISKLLSDSQRETGVFRAIGARNSKIASIYGLYTLQLAITSFLLALVIGEGICLWLTSRFADNVELAAADFGNTVISVSFVQFNPSHMATIFGGLVAGAFLGLAFPLLRALRRDPIKAIRDE